MASQRGAGILRRAAVGWIQKPKAGQNLLECEGHAVPFLLCARRWVATTMGQEAAPQDAGLLMMLNSEIKNAKESHRQLKASFQVNFTRESCSQKKSLVMCVDLR
jgi:hypothetical protein